MPTATRSISRESCQGGVQDARNASGTRVYRMCYALLTTRPAFHAGHRPRNWEADADGLEDAATTAGLTAADMLCRGCNVRRLRLIAAGTWPA